MRIQYGPPIVGEKSQFSFDVILGPVRFGIWIDGRKIMGRLGWWGFLHRWGYPLFPPKNPYFADNSFRGRLKRMFR